ncbi:hypothetical protein GCM10009759_55660 [Kitasatospora saccharophila]|uniref:LPXTG-motif cell wall-anchored protein n=1 Tax=Kitasatospora saccharophila TaxID=407973 RepID=A0ABN2XLD5_9ACTN
MSGTASVRRVARLALVPALAVGAFVLPGAVAFADTAAPSASPTAAPSASVSAVASPVPGAATPSLAPAPAADPKNGGLPRGGAQTGEAAVDGGSVTGLVVGVGLAAAGAAGIGLLVLRRRADSRA